MKYVLALLVLVAAVIVGGCGGNTTVAAPEAVNVTQTEDVESTSSPSSCLEALDLADAVMRNSLGVVEAMRDYIDHETAGDFMAIADDADILHGLKEEAEGLVDQYTTARDACQSLG